MPQHIEQSVLPLCVGYLVFVFSSRCFSSHSHSLLVALSLSGMFVPPPPPQDVFSASSAIVIVSSRCVIISFFVLPCMCYSVFPPLQHCRISRCIMIMLVIMFMTHSLHTTPIWREATRAPEWQRGLRFLTGMPEMDPLGIEPKAFHMQSGCDTTTP